MLVHALGPEGDKASEAVSVLLVREGIASRPLRVSGVGADWTLLITSGEHGDKLPIGFRGCHSAIGAGELAEAVDSIGPLDVLVVASLPNGLAEAALGWGGSAIRVFAPAMRNVTDRRRPLAGFAGLIDILSCNRGEWESIPAAEREAIEGSVWVRVETDGARGSRIYVRPRGGETIAHVEPAFPRKRPPRDTNRAGECYTSTVVRGLVLGGWRPGDGLGAGALARLAHRASAAAALVLDRERFGFPSDEEVEGAIAGGIVE